MEDFDYEKLFDESEMNTIDVNEYRQFGATVKRVNDTMDIGYLVDMNMNYRDRNIVARINGENPSFIHKYNGKNIIIHIDCLGDGSEFSDENAMAAAFLATGKYRLAINKKCINTIDKATIKTIEGETEIYFLDIFDEYLVEIPIPLIVMSDINLILHSKSTTPPQSGWVCCSVRKFIGPGYATPCE
ncbi:hypothetical protein [Treponema primitia]|uniref:hypothetical protein n=1 Tax=Treponema primitia TaxID=88058 RepID=UPI0011D1D87A|nr:hypothetical protein [Treponema primitia]